MPQITDRETIAANVRAAMARRRVDQAAIAGVIGKSRSSTSTRLTGLCHFRVDELQKIAAHLDVSLDSLLADESVGAAS